MCLLPNLGGAIPIRERVLMKQCIISRQPFLNLIQQFKTELSRVERSFQEIVWVNLSFEIQLFGVADMQEKITRTVREQVVLIASDWAESKK